MANYAKNLPRDVGGGMMQEYPAPFKTVSSIYYRDNLAPSSVIVLSQDTSAIEVGAFGGQGAVLRWVPITEVGNFGSSVISSGAGANWDHYIPPSQYRRFVVPKETGGVPQGGAVASINGLYQRVAISNAGATASSVLLSQF